MSYRGGVIIHLPTSRIREREEGKSGKKSNVKVSSRSQEEKSLVQTLDMYFPRFRVC